jgi:hypothetical protein
MNLSTLVNMERLEGYVKRICMLDRKASFNVDFP